MSSYRDKTRKRNVWRYEFQYKGQRHRAPRGFRTKELSDAAERKLRDRLVLRDHDLPDPDRSAPTFTRWAGVVYDFAVKREHLSDPHSLDHIIRQVLLFWGDEPSSAAKRVDGATYHGLTLDAPIRDGSWLLKFEDWMESRAISGSTKNHYRSACSKFYRVAMRPEFRTQTGIMINPFVGMPRDPGVKRTVVFTREQLQRVLLAAPTFLRTAIRIAVLAPELRLGNICALRWTDIDSELKWIRLADHKTARKTGRPLVTPIVPELRAYLQSVRKTQAKGCVFVVDRDGAQVLRRYMQSALEEACADTGVTYGQKHGGVTFHTIRHTAVTVMAEIGIPDVQRQQAVGHSAVQTTQGYTHLAPHHKIPALTELARALGETLRDGSHSGGPL